MQRSSGTNVVRILYLYILWTFQVATVPLTDAGTEHFNVREFNALCRLARIGTKAKDLQNETFISPLAEWSRVEEIRKQVSAFVSQTNQSGEATVRVSAGKFQVDILDPSQAGKAHILLQPLLKKLQEMEGSVTKLKDKAEQEFVSAQGEAIKAVTGKSQKLSEAQAGVVTDRYTNCASLTRGTACAQPTGEECSSAGARPGCDLVHDMICLCAPGASSKGVKICGVAAGAAAGTGSWDTTTCNAVPASTWNPLAAACAADTHGADFSEENIRNAIGEFMHLMGSNPGTGSAAHVNRWILGKVDDNAGTCDGATSSSGSVCVNYAQANKAFDQQKVLWLKRLEIAAQKLADIKGIARSVNKTNQEAFSVLLSAETILNEAALHKEGAVRRFNSSRSTALLQGEPKPAPGTTINNNMESNTKQNRIGWSNLVMLIL